MEYEVGILDPIRVRLDLFQFNVDHTLSVFLSLEIAIGLAYLLKRKML